MSLWQPLYLRWLSYRALPVVRDYYQSLLPLLQQPLAQVPLIAVDMEMTGLKPEQHQIISVGLVPIVQRQLRLAAAQHQLVGIAGSVGQSATIHGIVDRHLQSPALSQQDLLPWLLQQAMGKLMIFHHAPLDLAFLTALAQLQGDKRLHFPVVDTLQIERRRLLRERHILPQGSLRLGACRQRYGLPVYMAHSALMDAIACGELFLAQTAAINPAVAVNEFLWWP
ncbi:exonuclease domain-containing protein [Shewanella sp. YIC-542]|uniref:exonuclease domain-containing protein n=1 Tax=Shewanella mytili TaxID=3377111 RepID=UPI00398E81DA